MATATAVLVRARAVDGPGDDDVGEEGHGPQRDDDEPHPAEGGEEQVGRAAGHACPCWAARPRRRSRGTTSLVRARARRTRRRPGSGTGTRGAAGSAPGATRPTAR